MIGHRPDLGRPRDRDDRRAGRGACRDLATGLYEVTPQVLRKSAPDLTDHRGQHRGHRSRPRPVARLVRIGASEEGTIHA